MAKVIVVGAGIGGISTAIRLANKGYSVTIFEAQAAAGGKMAEYRAKGYRWDMGPSLFTLPELLEELFELCGKNPKDYYDFQALDLISKYFFVDGTSVNAYSNVEKLKIELSEKLNEPIENINSFLQRAKENYEFTKPIFLDNELKSFYKNLSGSFIGNIKNFLKLNIWQTMHASNSSKFQNEKTVQMFDRYATYNGSNPYKAPATLNLIAHLEHQLGAYFVKNGMYGIVTALVKLAKEIGVDFQFNSKVDEIITENNKATGIKMGGDVIKADIIVSNADISPTYKKLLPTAQPPNFLLNQEKSTSALVFYWGMKKEFPDLDLHNVFFAENYEQEFKLLSNEQVANDVTVYLYVSSKLNSIDAPKGCENWFVMINVPNNTGQDWSEIISRSKVNIIAKLSKHFSLSIEKYIETEYVLDPIKIESRTSSFRGALYGNSSNNLFAAFLRHANHSSTLKNLYFVGGSVHPGGGIPLCLLSSKIACKNIPNANI